jgi:hypothetical protein
MDYLFEVYMYRTRNIYAFLLLNLSIVMHGITYWAVYEQKLLPTLQILILGPPARFSTPPGQLLGECRHFCKCHFKTLDYDLNIVIGSGVQRLVLINNTVKVFMVFISLSEHKCKINIEI